MSSTSSSRSQVGGGWNWNAACRLVAAVVSALILSTAAASAKQVLVLEINGAIGPATADYVTRQFSAMRPADTEVVILRMNTPGGLDSSMREIIRVILSSPIPVVTYVAPAGARAASAGTYIAYASHIAAMAPGTNLGAATPIQLQGFPELPSRKPEQPSGQESRQDRGSSGEGKPGSMPTTEPVDTESRKVVNDAVAYIRSLAELNGRNADWAEQAVRAAVSLPASEALRLHVIDIIADDIPDLLHKIDGRMVKVDHASRRLATAGLNVAILPPDWRTEILAVITDPNIAFILMLIGVYGLIFEFLNPGSAAPGLIGAISLLVALFALSLLPINYAGAGLLLLGIGLMVAEAHIGSFGAIGLGGIIAFVIGSIIMFPSGVAGFTLSLSVVGVTVLVSAGLFLMVLSMLLQSRRRPVVTGQEALLGAKGECIIWRGNEGRVQVQGEVWRARADEALLPGTRIRVVGREGLVLVVEPI
jgi:membrane-bound serine protease (ClpP class)